MTQIYYAGKDISDYTDVKKCLLSDRAGGKADNVSIMFPDSEKIWGKWGPKKGDTLRVKTETYDTGLMYVDSFNQGAGVFTLEAISTPLGAKQPHTRIWRDIRLSAIAQDIASAYGLSVSTYDFADYTYKAISQINEADIGFLNRLCIREGDALKISNGKLIIFGEKAFEAKDSGITITADDVIMPYDFRVSDAVLSSYTVLYVPPMQSAPISYTATDSKISGGSGRRLEMLSSVGEAQRWAKNYLRAANKNHITAWLPMKYITIIAAGSVVTIEGFGAFDGKYYVFAATYDTVNNKTYLGIRQTLSY